MSHDKHPRGAGDRPKPEDTKYEEAEEVGLEGLAPDKAEEERDAEKG